MPKVIVSPIGAEESRQIEFTTQPRKNEFIYICDATPLDTGWYQVMIVVHQSDTGDLPVQTSEIIVTKTHDPRI